MTILGLSRMWEFWNDPECKISWNVHNIKIIFVAGYIQPPGACFIWQKFLLVTELYFSDKNLKDIFSFFNGNLFSKGNFFFGRICFVWQHLFLWHYLFSVREISFIFSVKINCFSDRNLFCKKYPYLGFYRWFPGKRFRQK